MLIKLNGKQLNVKGSNNILELIESTFLNAQKVVVEHNYQIIQKENWQRTSLSEGDNVEIVSFVGGG